MLENFRQWAQKTGAASFHAFISLGANFNICFYGIGRGIWTVLVAPSFCPSIWWQRGCHCVMCLHFAAGWSWKHCSHKENQGAWKMCFAILLHCSSFNYWDLGCGAVSQHVPKMSHCKQIHSYTLALLLCFPPWGKQYFLECKTALCP